MEYGGKYYVVGSGRQPLQKDKTVTEDYYLLTLAAVAKELEYRSPMVEASKVPSTSISGLMITPPHIPVSGPTVVAPMAMRK